MDGWMDARKAGNADARLRQAKQFTGPSLRALLPSARSRNRQQRAPRSQIKVKMSVGDTLLARVWLALCAHAPCLPFVISIEKGEKNKECQVLQLRRAEGVYRTMEQHYAMHQVRRPAKGQPAKNGEQPVGPDLIIAMPCWGAQMIGTRARCSPEFVGGQGHVSCASADLPCTSEPLLPTFFLSASSATQVRPAPQAPAHAKHVRHRTRPNRR